MVSKKYYFFAFLCLFFLNSLPVGIANEKNNDIKTFAKLNKLPKEIIFPDGLKEKISYDKNNKDLIFIGFMPKEEKETLYKLSKNRSYRFAIDTLFKKSNSKKPKLEANEKSVPIFLETIKNILPKGEIREENDQIKIGLYFPGAKNGEFQKEMGLLGALLAQKNRPSILNKKIVLVDSVKKIDNLSKAIKFFKKQKVVSIIGDITPNANPEEHLKTVEEANIPFIVLRTLNTQPVEKKENIFCLYCTDYTQIYSLIEFLNNTLKEKIKKTKDDNSHIRVNIIAKNEPYFKLLAANFSNNYPNSQLFEYQNDSESIVDSKETINIEIKKLLDQITKIYQSKKPNNDKIDYILHLGPEKDTALIMRLSWGLGFNFISSNFAESLNLFIWGGQKVEGLHLPSFYPPDFSDQKAIENSNYFISYFKGQVGIPPSFNASLSWDAYNLIIDSILKAKSSNPDKFKKLFYNKIDGVSGLNYVNYPYPSINSKIKVATNGNFQGR